MANHFFFPSDPNAASDRDRELREVSSERFDRTAFARRALDLARPAHTTVAICEGASHLRLETGRVWGTRAKDGTNERWALLAVSSCASRRAIALAVAELAREPPAYAFDLLLAAANEAT